MIHFNCSVEDFTKVWCLTNSSTFWIAQVFQWSCPIFYKSVVLFVCVRLWSMSYPQFIGFSPKRWEEEIGGNHKASHTQYHSAEEYANRYTTSRVELTDLATWKSQRIQSSKWLRPIKKVKEHHLHPTDVCFQTAHMNWTTKRNKSCGLHSFLPRIHFLVQRNTTPDTVMATSMRVSWLTSWRSYWWKWVR